MSHEKTWRNLKCIFLSERSQSEKATYFMIPTTWHFGKGKTMETVNRSVVARGFAGNEGDRWSTENFSDSENTLYDTIMMNTCH